MKLFTCVRESVRTRQNNQTFNLFVKTLRKEKKKSEKVVHKKLQLNLVDATQKWHCAMISFFAFFVSFVRCFLLELIEKIEYEFIVISQTVLNECCRCFERHLMETHNVFTSCSRNNTDTDAFYGSQIQWCTAFAIGHSIVF